jgi:two-component system, cell cycle sensor histidine kinase and response regulator CckA
MLRPMPRPLRLLLVEDSPNDTDLLLRHLSREGLQVEHRRVETRQELTAALDDGAWDVVVSDYGLPRFSGLDAIATTIAFDPDLPVILVSGTVGEEAAAEVMRAGARDFVLKGSLARLALAMQREVKDSQQRRAQRREAQIMLATQSIARAGGWEWDRESNELFWTAGVGQLLEAPPGFRPTLENVTRCLPAGERAKVRAQLATGTEAIDLDVRMNTLAGHELTLRLVARVERKGGQVSRLVGAILDVTEHRQLEASLRLKDRLISMGTIAASVAHEINNPLTHLVASLPLVLEGIKRSPADPELPELLEAVSKAPSASRRSCAT